MNDTRLFFAKILDHQKIIMTFDPLFPMQAGATMPHVARLLQTCVLGRVSRYTQIRSSACAINFISNWLTPNFRSKQKPMTDDKPVHPSILLMISKW